MASTIKATRWPLCIALVAALSAPAMATDTPEPGRIHVSGTGEVDVAPDKATLTAQLWEQTAFVNVENPEELKPDDMLKARQALEERVRNVILTLEEINIESRHIKAGSLTIGQTQTYKRLENGQHQSMIATRVERPIEVTLLDLEQVPEVLNTLTEQGVNYLSGVSYGVQDMDAARREALAEAIDNARLEAEVMASGLGVEIGRVLEVSRGQVSLPQPPQSYAMARASMAESADAQADQKAEYRAGETS
ncbi:SIMPL domain-containing protein, partial [Halomonas sp.]|uniref:SIMPL domain-containing protein n=1 Tax=Halomonas sp. TaxID=1486246 RepID=UPI003562EDB9